MQSIPQFGFARRRFWRLALLAGLTCSGAIAETPKCRLTIGMQPDVSARLIFTSYEPLLRLKLQGLQLNTDDKTALATNEDSLTCAETAGSIQNAILNFQKSAEWYAYSTLSGVKAIREASRADFAFAGPFVDTTRNALTGSP